MGAVNATPDSFSGDGLGTDVAAIVARALAMADAGAAIVDLGGESTRPGAAAVSAGDELARVLPALRALKGRIAIPISIDTMKAVVADAALSAGAAVVNDVSGLRDPALASVVARHGAWVVVMHNGWNLAPRPSGQDIVPAVIEELRRLVGVAIGAGVDRARIVVDPGLGFGKSPAESLELLRALPAIRGALAPHPVLVGPSRKRFIGAVLEVDVSDRLAGTLACVAVAAFLGAELIRVHDVAPAVHAARMGAALARGRA
jgi:dihydropteroate synthase